MPLLRSIVLFGLTVCTASTATAAPVHPAKVVIVGIDGVSLNVLEPYVEAGVTPNLAKLFATGSRGHLESYWPARTPQVWTSAVTGKLPGQHGIWDHLSNTWPNPPEVKTKEKRVITVKDRKSKALWNLLDKKGLRSLVVGWMVTWPAEKLENGVIVAPKELLNDKRQTTIKGSFYRDADRLVEPARLWPKVKGLLSEADDITAAELEAFADIPPPLSPLYRLKYLERYMYTFAWSLARAKSVEAVTVGLVGEAKPDLVLSYFQCPDTMGHRFWIFKESIADIEQRLTDLALPKTHAAELKKRFGRSLKACYRDVDARLGRILAASQGPDTLVLVISDHGFGHCERPHPFKSEPYGGVHLDQGVIVAAGPGIAGNQVVEGISILDITPTVLHYLGQPVAGDMRGKVATALFKTGEIGRRPPLRISSYEATPQSECLRPEGYPPRRGRLRPTAAQMGGRNPHP